MLSCPLLLTSFSQSNVLIKGNGKACLSDFGLSRIFLEVTDCSYLTSTVRGSVRWAAPELFQIGEEQQKESIHILPSPQSDIYSFGSTMLQVRFVLVCDHDVSRAFNTVAGTHGKGTIPLLQKRCASSGCVVSWLKTRTSGWAAHRRRSVGVHAAVLG